MILLKKIRVERGEEGFSFFELMVVIALIAIVSAISYPYFLDMKGRYRLKAAARDVFSSLQVNKMEAVKTSTVVAVFFDDATSSYRVCHNRNVDWRNANDHDCEQAVPLDSAVSFSRGTVLTKPDNTSNSDDIEYIDDIVGFFQDGTGFESDQTRISGTRYVYLSSLNSPEVYAVGVNRVGLVQLFVWTQGSGWQ
ncbi:MAG: prepilin-type N-terminal cleavage/methylation domain-containing protein [Desulfobulbaceae bacterium]|nr:prepilin-type N-terminal cleavage/methylation domain-containing protein [Desulfobulbaceae bacterium]